MEQEYKYYSTKTNKIYDTKEALIKANEEFTKKQEEEKKKQAARKERADEIKEAKDNLIKASKKYEKLIEDFVNDYGSFHDSIISTDDDGLFGFGFTTDIFDLLHKFF